MTPLLTFYGDDFTGSTAVMEVLSFAGIPTMLFMEPPQPDILSQYPELQAIGVAGVDTANVVDTRAIHGLALDVDLPGSSEAVEVVDIEAAERCLQGGEDIVDLDAERACLFPINVEINHWRVV